jgi:uncharacterized membrane protein YgcG
MKKRILTAIFLILASALLISHLAHASGVSALESIMKESMYDALRQAGIGDRLAAQISERYVFMGTMMVNKVWFDESDGGDDMLDGTRSTGRALGAVLAASYMQYGVDALQETASVMMLSTRAGMSPEAAAGAFVILAQNDYGLDSSIEIMREASEIVRGLKPSDGGAAICSQVVDMARTQTPAGELRGEILSAAEREMERQRQLLALKEMERIKNDNKGGDGNSGGDGGSSASGGNGGGASAASAGGGGSNASGSSGSGSSGSSSGSSGSASGASAGGGASDSGSSGSDSGASDGGNASDSGSSGSDSGGSASDSASSGGDSASGSDQGEDAGK